MSLSITVPANVVLSGNPIWVEVTNTRTVSSVKNLYTCVKIEAIDVGGATYATRILKQKGNTAKFDISSQLDIPYDFKFALSSDDSSAITHDNMKMCDFKITPGESFVNPYNDYIEYWGDSANIKTLKGKLDNYNLKLLNEEETTFYDKYIAKRFLTEIEGKTIYVKHASHPVKFFFNWWASSTTGYNVVITLYYSDNTTEESLISFDSTFEFLKFAEFSGELIAEAYSTHPDKTITQYTVAIVSSTVNTVMTVVCTNEFTDDYSTIYFVNKFGTVEAVNCYGDYKIGSEIEKETFSRTLQSNDLFYSPDENVSIKNDISISINTGFKTRDERRWIQDLLLSPYKKAWIRTGWLKHLPDCDYGFAPITIKSSSQIDNSSTDVLGIDIEASISYNY